MNQTEETLLQIESITALEKLISINRMMKRGMRQGKTFD